MTSDNNCNKAEKRQAELPAQLKSPVEIQIPVAGVMDHGLTLVHDMDWKPRNYLHEVSFARTNNEVRAYLVDAGYSYRCGWVQRNKDCYWDAVEMDTWSKRFPLSVEAWTR